MNIVNSKEYQGTRKEIEKYFVDKNIASTKEKREFNGYSLKIDYYKTKEGSWQYTRGIVSKDGTIIADIKRNYSSFPYLFLHHNNGNDYLICGEDYQGYTIVNLTKKEINTYIPEAWKRGAGFCWTDIHDYDEYGDELHIEGCVWGGEFEHVIYDFSNPDNLPLKEIERYNDDMDYEKDDDDDDDMDYDDDNDNYDDIDDND